MSTPTIADLTVRRRDAETLEVSSWLTQGRCATVYMFAFSENLNVQECLIPTYMQGITSVLILEAVNTFLATEKTAKPTQLDKWKRCCEKAIRANFRARNTRVYESDVRHQRILRDRRTQVRAWISALRLARHPETAQLVAERVRWKIA